MCVTPLFFFLWGGKKQLTTGTLAGAIYTYRCLFWVTPFALVALLSATSSDATASRKVASRSKTKAVKSLQPSCALAAYAR